MSGRLFLIGAISVLATGSVVHGQAVDNPWSVGAVAPATSSSALRNSRSRPTGACRLALAGVANVRDFGALGDGSTDDAPAIQTAIDSLVHGGIVYFPPGNYAIHVPLRVWRSGTALRGSGLGSYIVNVNAQDVAPSAIIVRGCLASCAGPGDRCPDPAAEPTCYPPGSTCAGQAALWHELTGIEIAELGIFQGNNLRRPSPDQPDRGGWTVDVCSVRDLTISSANVSAAVTAPGYGGLRVQYSSHVYILNSGLGSAYDADTYGVFFDHVHDVYLAGNRQDGYPPKNLATGIRLVNADGAALVANTVEGFAHGIVVEDSRGVSVMGYFEANGISVETRGDSAGLVVSGCLFGGPLLSATRHVQLAGRLQGARVFGNHFAECARCLSDNGGAPISVEPTVTDSMIGPNAFAQAPANFTKQVNGTRDSSVIVLSNDAFRPGRNWPDTEGRLEVGSIKVGGASPMTSVTAARSVVGAICTSTSSGPVPCLGTGFTVHKVRTGIFDVFFGRQFAEPPVVEVSSATDGSHPDTSVRAGWNSSLSAIDRVRLYTTDHSGRDYVDADTIVSFSASEVSVDVDQDGFTTFEGDCNDADSGAWGRPSEVGDLLLERDHVTLAWSPPAQLGAASVSYDVLRATTPTSFSSSTCVASSTPSTAVMDATSPASENGFFYLVRANNACPSGRGALGFDSSGQEIVGSPCP